MIWYDPTYPPNYPPTHPKPPIGESSQIINLETEIKLSLYLLV